MASGGAAVTLSATPARSSTAGAPPSTEQRTSGPRLYELVIRNLTARQFKLQGPAQAALRKTAEGRLLSVEAAIGAAATPASALPRSVGPALQPDTHLRAPTSALAVFSSGGSRGETLEFVLGYDDGGGEGFTIRVHANQSSPLRSDVIATGHDLQVSSHREEVQRLVCTPPEGYAELALGVYATAARCQAELVGQLCPGDEVLAASGARQGRWMRIAWPLQGWLQAETRDGQPLLQPVPSSGNCRPHTRQVVSVRPAPRPQSSPPPQGAGQVQAAQALSSALAPAPPQERAVERGFVESRTAEVARMHRNSEELERAHFLGRHRAALRGIF